MFKMFPKTFHTCFRKGKIFSMIPWLFFRNEDYQHWPHSKYIAMRVLKLPLFQFISFRKKADHEHEIPGYCRNHHVQCSYVVVNVN